METGKLQLGRATMHTKCRNIAVLLFVFIFSFAFRLLYIDNTLIFSPIMKDAKLYINYAENLSKYGVYSHSSEEKPKSDSQITPGYPLFLYFIQSHSDSFNHFYHNVLTLQAFLGALTCLLVLLIGRIFLPFWLSVFASLLTSISPHLITLSSYILTETLFTFLLLIAMLFLVLSLDKKKIRYIFIASVLVGMASLVRPVFFLYPFFFLPVLCFVIKPPRRNQFAFAWILGLILCWAPWQVWCHSHVTEEPTEPGLASFSLITGLYPDLTHKDPKRKGYPYLDDPQFYELTGHPQKAWAVFRERISRDPLTYVRWFAWGKPVLFWSWSILKGQGDVYIYPVSTSFYHTNAFAGFTHRLMKKGHLVFLISCGIGLIVVGFGWKSDRFPEPFRNGCMVLFSLLLYFTLVHVVFTPLPRYSIPLRPALYLGALTPLAAAYLCGTHRRLRSPEMEAGRPEGALRDGPERSGRA